MSGAFTKVKASKVTRNSGAFGSGAFGSHNKKRKQKLSESSESSYSSSSDAGAGAGAGANAPDLATWIALPRASRGTATANAAPCCMTCLSLENASPVVADTS